MPGLSLLERETDRLGIRRAHNHDLATVRLDLVFIIMITKYLLSQHKLTVSHRIELPNQTRLETRGTISAEPMITPKNV